MLTRTFASHNISCSRFGDVLTRNTESFGSEDDLAHNPLAVYVTVRHLTVDLRDMNRRMEKNSYHVVRRMLSEGLDLPDENDLYVEVHDLIELQRAYNLTVRDIMNGRLTLDTTTEFPLTGNFKWLKSVSLYSHLLKRRTVPSSVLFS